jgi:hypothetical protein
VSTSTPSSARLKEKFGVCPIWVNREVVRAQAYRALPLIIAAYRLMRLKRTTTITLTQAVWADVGPLTARARHAVLENLKKVPGIMRLEAKRRAIWPYRLTLGELWLNPPKTEDADEAD